MCIYIYMFIDGESERQICVRAYIYICLYIYTCIYAGRAACWGHTSSFVSELAASSFWQASLNYIWLSSVVDILWVSFGKNSFVMRWWGARDFVVCTPGNVRSGWRTVCRDKKQIYTYIYIYISIYIYIFIGGPALFPGLTWFLGPILFSCQPCFGAQPYSNGS